MNGKLAPFERAYLNMEPLDKFIDRYVKQGISPQEAQRQYDKLLTDIIWKNDEYQVNVDQDPDHGFGRGVAIWHLSIKRLDKEPVHDWRDLQAIKNAICGEAAEALELYPSEGRIVDTANQYHLWAFMADGERLYPLIPVGWTERMVTDKKEAKAFGAKQRKL
jgi:hypothetical protein